jgi:hypothetical protein
VLASLESKKMRQRGRKSSEHLAIMPVDGRPSRLEPPTYLTPEEIVLFKELIDACAADHFRSSDMPILVSLVQATLLARNTGRDPAMVAEFDRLARLQATLATKLRLTVQSRTDPKNIGRQQLLPTGPLPWQTHRAT